MAAAARKHSHATKVVNLRAKMKQITKEVRERHYEGHPRPIAAIFYDHKNKEYKRIRYAFIDTSIPKISGHVLFLPVMSRIELVHLDTGFQIGWIKKSATGVVTSKFCWEEAAASVKNLLREKA